MHTDPLGRKHSEVLEYISCSNVDRRSVFPVRHSFVPFPLRWARSPSKANDQGTIQWAQHKLLLCFHLKALQIKTNGMMSSTMDHHQSDTCFIYKWRKCNVMQGWC